MYPTYLRHAAREEKMSDGEHPSFLNYADPNVDRWVAIAFFPRTYLAHLAASVLESEGIPNRFGNAAPPPLFKGCELQVRADDYQKAAEILSRTPARQLLTPSQEPRRQG